MKNSYLLRTAGLFFVLALFLPTARGADGSDLFFTTPHFDLGRTAGFPALSDLNHDGKLDLVVANYASNTVSVALGNGDGTFQPAWFYGVGKTPTSVVIKDFNRDGHADIAVANRSSTNVSILLGLGDGTFQPALSVGAVDTPGVMAAGDFDGDGKMDLAVPSTDSSYIAVFLGNGDGSFQARKTNGTYYTLAVAVGDFNKDGKPDLATVNGIWGMNVLLGNGDGTFQTAQKTNMTHKLVSVAVGDFNGDGKEDLTLVDQELTAAFVMLGNGDGTFQAARTLSLGIYASPYPSFIVVGDFDGDTRQDLAVAISRANNVSLLLGNGDGSFQNPRSFSANAAEMLAAGDLDGDGRLDLLGTSTANSNIFVLLGQDHGTFNAAPAANVGNNPSWAGIADFNRDGLPDAAVINNYGANMSVLLNVGAGYFQSCTNYYGTGNGPRAMTVADFNRDGNPDVAVVSDSAGVFVLLGNADGTFQTSRYIKVTNGPVAVVAGDFNGDGKADLAVRCADACYLAILFGNGDGTFQTPQFTLSYCTTEGMSVGDFNGDGKPDLVMAQGDSVVVLLNNGNGTFQSGVRYQAGSLAYSIAVTDVNLDGKLDLVVANSGSNNVSVLLGNGNGTFQSQRLVAAHSRPYAVAVDDFNGDGKPDLAVANHGTNTISLLLGRGDGTFEGPWHYRTPYGPYFVASADFNGDHRPDLLFGDEITEAVFVWFGKSYNRRPLAICRNMVVAADGTGKATANIDAGSYDLDSEDTITLVQSPPGPYSLGTNLVTLTVLDNHGNSNSCTANVIVVNFGQTVSLIPTGSMWKYLDTGTNPGTAWKETNFNDSAWASGPAQLGYGDGDEATVVSYGTNSSSKYLTTYFRRSFYLPVTGWITNLGTRYIRDDGAVVYLNGVEVFRSNMPSGVVSYTTLASGAEDTAIENNFHTNALPASLLVAGTNVIAVEIHQSAANSSDTSLELELIANSGLGSLPPALSISSPTNGQSLSGGCVAGVGVAITAVASSFVTNVSFTLDNATTLVAPQTTNPFSVTFPNVPVGAHSVAAAALDSFGSVANAAPVVFSTLPNMVPVIALTNPPATVLVGTAITNVARVTDDGAITNVDFYLDGVKVFTRTAGPYTYVYNDSTVGTHSIAAVVSDNCGATANSGTVTITVTNPPADHLILLANHSTWKYFGSATGPAQDAHGLSWYQVGFDDSAWTAGVAELGYGDSSPNAGTDATYPEVTVIPKGTPTYITYYFRTAFNVARTNGLLNLIVNLLDDDGAVVFVNGRSIWTNNFAAMQMANPITNGTLAANAVNDGTVYQVLHVNPIGLLQNGQNTVAVEVHQVAATSVDLSFDLMLWGQRSSEPPSIICPSDVTVSTDFGACYSSGVILDTPTSSSECGSVTVTSNALPQFPLGTNLVTWTATDACGNTNTCMQRVIVHDMQPPAITCPPDLTVGTAPGSCFSNVAFTVTGSDLCGTANVLCAPPSGSAFAKGLTPVNCTATDAASNTATCTFTVTVTDPEPPQITCPSDIAVSTASGSCFSNAVFTATATDNCGTVNVLCVPPSGSAFAVGTNLVNCTATDSASNTATCAFTVTINDPEPPQITCPTNLVVAADAGQCAKSNVTLVASATDSCAVTNMVCEPASGSTFAVGIHPVACTATDASSNTASCNFTVTVLDTEPPAIICPSNQVVNPPAGSSTTTVDFIATSADNCDPSPIIVCAPPSGITFPIGTTSIQCTATDTAGNTNSCHFSIRVNARPLVSLVAPTNNATFPLAHPISLLADASDPDGDGVARVDFFAGTNLLGSATSGYVFIWTNAPGGPHSLTARATDGASAEATSSAVQITVLAQPPTSYAPVTSSNLNRQTGLYVQPVRITNPTASTFDALRLWIALDTNSLAHNVRVWNATGTSNGVPFVLYNQPLPPGQSVDLSIEYYIPDRRTMPNPVFTVELIPASTPTDPTGTVLEVDRALRLTDGTFWVEFSTLSNRVYYLQYGGDVSAWKTALPAVPGTGHRVSWRDAGPPKTESAPQSANNRFYRILLLP